MTNSKSASKLINVFLQQVKVGFGVLYIAISVSVFFLEINYFSLWNFFLSSSSFSFNEVNNLFFLRKQQVAQMVCEPFLPLYMEIFSNPKLQGNIFELQKNKTNESPFCIMLAFMKILSPLSPRALCQGHFYLVLRFQSLSLSSSSVSTFSNTINSNLGAHHYFNVKMHLGTKAFSTETI